MAVFGQKILHSVLHKMTSVSDGRYLTACIAVSTPGNALFLLNLLIEVLVLQTTRACEIRYQHQRGMERIIGIFQRGNIVWR
jgi:hypothetical protein